MKRLLVASWALPPILKPRSLQVARVLKALAALGWTIDVISVQPSSSITARPLDRDIEKYYQGIYKVFYAKESPIQFGVLALGSLFSPLKPIPDGEIGWRRAATILGLQLLRNEQYDVLLSFAQPWSSHLVGHALHKASGLPWVAHFSDPWVDNPYYRRYNASQRSQISGLEKQIVETANHVIFTNQFTASKVMQKYPAQWRDKTSVIPHAYDASILPKVQSTNQRAYLRMVYAGSLYGLRSAETLIRALAQVKNKGKIRIEIIGAIADKKKYQELAHRLGVSNNIHFFAQVTYRESLKLLATSDVLLLIDANSSSENLFLPSKLVDYLMFNKPIFGITPIQGASAELLRQLECPIFSPEDVLGITNGLDGLINSWTKGELNLSAKALDVVQGYSSEAVTRDFDRILSDLSFKSLDGNYVA